MTEDQGSLNVESYVADPQVRIGHVHLKVANLERSLKFYAGVLGLEVTMKMGLEHLGEPGRAAAGSGNDGAVSYGDCLPHAGGAGRGVAAGD
jgi:catechol 2,3-dioxygenase-like lactoylglutathione lyase family enzyme